MSTNPPNLERWFRNRAQRDLPGLLRLTLEYLIKCDKEKAGDHRDYDNQRQMKVVADKLRGAPWMFGRDDFAYLHDYLPECLAYLRKLDMVPQPESETCHS